MGRLDLPQVNAETYHLASPEQFLQGLRFQGQRDFSLLLGDEDMNVFLLRRHGDEDLPSNAEGRILKVRRLGYLGQGQRVTANLGDFHWRQFCGRNESVLLFAGLTFEVRGGRQLAKPDVGRPLD